MSPAAYTYSGSELDLFAGAQNWKKYCTAQIAPYIRGSVLEVGAGLGANSVPLQTCAVSDWCCLEPDAALLDRLRQNLAGKTCVPTETVRGTLTHFAGSKRLFDTILYLDVLEHIEADRQELQDACSCLAPGGKLVVLAPAHNLLLSAFDRTIGHFRRYDKRALGSLTPPGAQLLRMWYLDSLGTAPLLANRVLLKQGEPTQRQIIAWNRFMIPMSRRLDPLFGYRVGKTIVGVWSKL